MWVIHTMAAIHRALRDCFADVKGGLFAESLEAFAEADGVGVFDGEGAVLGRQLSQVLLSKFVDFGERREAAGDHFAIAHDRAQEAVVVFWTWFVGQLDNILLPLWVAIDFFFAGPGAFNTGNFYLWMFCTGFIDVPDFFVDGSERAACYTMFC